MMKEEDANGRKGEVEGRRGRGGDGNAERDGQGKREELLP